MRLVVSLAPAVRLASVVLLSAVSAAVAAETYPFEGSWVRADRICSATAPSLRTYSAHDLVSSAGHCGLRKIAFGSGEWELFQDCRKTDHPGTAVERIRMLGPDAMLLKHQVNRLKIPRGRRYVRCDVGSGRPPPVVRPPAPAQLAPSAPAASPSKP